MPSTEEVVSKCLLVEGLQSLLDPGGALTSRVRGGGSSQPRWAPPWASPSSHTRTAVRGLLMLAARFAPANSSLLTPGPPVALTISEHVSTCISCRNHPLGTIYCYICLLLIEEGTEAHPGEITHPRVYSHLVEITHPQGRACACFLPATTAIGL